MAILLTPTTELEAVNECLANIGQTPVATISGVIGVDAQQALALVRSISREVQNKGFYWNTEKEYPLNKDTNGNIFVPSYALSVDPDGNYRDRDYVQRGNRLYDRKNHTFTFTENITVTMVLGLPFDQMPESGRRYVALRAARIFQNRTEGSNDPEDVDAERDAYNELVADDLRVSDHNMLTGNWETADMLRRYVY